MNGSINEYYCPWCGSVLPGEDVNLQTGLALCRSCGYTGKADDVKRACFCVEKPPCITLDKCSMNGRRLIYRRFGWEGLAMMVFAVVWDSALVSFLSDIFSSPFSHMHAAGLLLFLLPFVLAGIVVPVMGLRLLFGRMVVEVGRGQGTVFRGIGPVGWSWRFFFSGKETARVVEVKSSKGTVLQLVAVPQPGGKDFRFGWGNQDVQVAEYICAWLNRKSV